MKTLKELLIEEFGKWDIEEEADPTIEAKEAIRKWLKQHYNTNPAFIEILLEELNQ